MVSPPNLGSFFDLVDITDPKCSPNGQHRQIAAANAFIINSVRTSCGLDLQHQIDSSFSCVISHFHRKFLSLKEKKSLNHAMKTYDLVQNSVRSTIPLYSRRLL
ncbi:hypothetical protein GEMRC1_004187 [Eukaryota sp. GEM-RC1]